MGGNTTASAAADTVWVNVGAVRANARRRDTVGFSAIGAQPPRATPARCGEAGTRYNAVVICVRECPRRRRCCLEISKESRMPKAPAMWRLVLVVEMFVD